MNPPVVLITGAAGFLGSAIARDLSADQRVVAADIREPSDALRAATPAVHWARVDVADASSVRELFAAAHEQFGPPDVVIHLAAYYHFGDDPRDAYARVNLDGTRHVLDAAASAGAGRLLFASSQMALAPPAPGGGVLTEATAATSRLPYGESKAAGEQMCRDASGRLPVAVLRIGGVFSDWCELPPLHSLMRTWGGRGPLARAVPGAGRTGFAYLHRRALVDLVRRTVERRAALDRFEVLLASEPAATDHRQIFPALRRALRRGERPLHVPTRIARLGLRGRCLAAACVGRESFEQPWMMDFVDRPLSIDNTRTRQRLGWDVPPELTLLARLPVLAERFARSRPEWERRNRLRNAAQYEYAAD